MNKRPTQKYIEHITETEPQARAQGDQQYLKAGEKDKPLKTSKEFDDYLKKVDYKGNQSKEYYE